MSKSFIEKLIPFITNMRVGEGEDAPVTSLTPFSVGQIIKGFDFGNVKNGDVSAELDNFLLTQLPDFGGSESTIGYFMIGDGDISLMGYNMNNIQEGLGIIFTSDNNLTVLYATQDFDIEGTSGTKGFQNLTGGKYNLDYSSTIVEVSENIEDTSWNGTLIGAIEEEPGPEPPTPPTPGDLTPFESGGSLHAGDKLVVDLSASNSDIVNYLSTLTYDPQSYSCLLLNTTNEPGHSGQSFRIAAMQFGTQYVIMGTDATGYPSSFWGYDTSTGEGGWQLKEFDGDNYYTIKVDGGVEYYSNIVLNDTAEGWNGVFIGVEKGE